MGTVNDLTLVNNFGEQTTNQIVGGSGTQFLQRLAVGFADLNAAGSGVALVLGLAIPINAIIKKVYYNVTTTFADNGTSTDQDTSTLSIGANSAVDLKAAVTIANGANAWDVGIVDGIPTGTAATMVKATAARHVNVSWTHGSGNSTALIAGQMNVYVEYVLGT